jgi:hypothetical protein
MRSCILPAIFVFVLFSLNTSTLRAQTIGIGFQVGDPTGLNLHFRNPGGKMRPDVLFAYDLDDFLFVNLHGLWFKRIANTVPLNFYYGPGAFVGWYNRKRDYRRPVVGFSGNFGLNYEFSRLDLFLQLTPRLPVLPATDFDMGGGLGLRFFL